MASSLPSYTNAVSKYVPPAARNASTMRDVCSTSMGACSPCPALGRRMRPKPSLGVLVTSGFWATARAA